MTEPIKPYTPKNPVRAVTAASLFDGHDAAINIIRRILQGTGVEVIHLGHNRSVSDVVRAAVQEDVHAICASCYQGGHVEFFKYIVDLLKENNCGHIKVFGGGGGVIVPEEIAELHAYGVTKIYSPEDGRRMGLQGMINHLVRTVDYSLGNGQKPNDLAKLSADRPDLVARAITLVERAALAGQDMSQWRAALKPLIGERPAPVVGVTGTGGAGKSSLTDELLIRFLHDFPQKRVAVISVDPTRRKSGGALLGDRIRLNSMESERVYLRSLATRSSGLEISQGLDDVIAVTRAAGFDLILVETAGIGQGDAAVVDHVDISLYVMTSEFGAASQLEKIDMLDFADIVVINKFDRRGAEDALRDVRKQLQRNRGLWDVDPEALPVYGAIAARFNDDGVTALYLGLLDKIRQKTGVEFASPRQRPAINCSADKTIIVPAHRERYLSEIAEAIRGYHQKTRQQAALVRRSWQMKNTHDYLAKLWQGDKERKPALDALRAEVHKLEEGLSERTHQLLAQWPQLQKAYSGSKYKYKVRDKQFSVPLTTRSLCGLDIPKVCLPQWEDPAEIYSWMRAENLPGNFPFTAGVFPFKRTDEDPTRMFAGEGDPFRTNRRFKLLSRDAKAARLSTAFDSVTLYGWDPDLRPDIYGKVGNSGVSICTLDDMKVLYDGFDLCDPNTSVSMTINGPAPIMLAFFFNTALDQQLAKFQQEQGRQPSDDERRQIMERVLRTARGTVQADILKEDQGQNTCIFSIDFALRMMGDIQEFFIKNDVRNFYSVSISGYHIAEAGANPITQLALTLANGFTYVEYYLARGMNIDDFAPNLSFFFSNGMDPEYTVIGRVARRIWAVAMSERYGAGPRSQMLKYHIQTSGRSLHSQEIQFNDIRTTLQGLCAIYDNCNSLHTNAYDEAITTPTEESVRRALAIQLIINREWGLAKNQNPLQGAFIVNELTDLVEEAVLAEFDRLTARGGVLGAMETGYQRSKIQDESIYYEIQKHTGELPIIGVNTFLPAGVEQEQEPCVVELARATEEEKQSQLQRLAQFHRAHAEQAPAALHNLQQVALDGGNIFAELINTVRHCSLGQITKALYDVGGMYRRGM
ncbi:methylmalonyl-CoA mutase, large subunit [Desulfarculus baarsii DSM 2075]|uniref:Fused isobutyryl-CoA mutase n=1 Tax=Desulfarculus baarsii (strain ATCC 33931 / DSM 2075 / LMG 7858 / VKM B-1802 / 2st14) TaxID=644282 RepID=E1QF12_DESB2|nr:fused isobutyryl-CoA mutase/GTPase IcmF [Desulfarculus baarsii]ADK84148.1 methylmalonyl-CoA mutase, large subunit [Desulfarculus baarsii DSM 2075]